MLVAGNGLIEAFTVSKSAEVEAASPTVLVYIRGKIVIAMEVRPEKLIDE